MDRETPATSDSAEAFEAKDTAHVLPIGWLALLFGLVAWGAVYLWQYSPALGGWSQEAEYRRSTEAAAAEAQEEPVNLSVVATIGFTVAAAVGLAGFGARSKKRP